MVKSILIFDELLRSNPARQKHKTTMQSELEEAIFKEDIITIDTNNKTEAKIISAKKRALRNDIIIPLEDWNYLKKKKEGRENRLYLTKDGENIFEIFKLFSEFLI